MELDTDAVLIGDPQPRRLRHRDGDPQALAAAVAADVTQLSPDDEPAVVALDAPTGVPGAPDLAALITERLRAAGHRVHNPTPTAIRAAVCPDDPAAGSIPPGARYRWAPVAAGLVAAALTVAAILATHRHAPPAAGTQDVPTSTLIDGHLAVAVPAGWTLRRITSGPGSARIEVMSGVDPQLALHLTQARSGTDPATTAEALRQAVAAAPPGVFVDFDPGVQRYGRPGIGYRELRPGREITWTVLADAELRIGIGCQSPPGQAALVAAVCETAVRTAHRVR